MREIKIRGQRKYSEEWNYLNLSEYLTSDSKPQPEMLQYLHRNICQFTGLKDINGTDIYEGDILHKPFQSAVPKFIIEWNETRCLFDDIPMYGNGKTKAHEFTIIGNIYEHPHLIV